MTVIREPFAPELRPLHARASEAGGTVFADALCEISEDARFRLRMRERGAYPPMQVKIERGKTAAIFEAARALHALLWTRDGDPDAAGLQRWQPAGGHLFTGHKALLSRLDADLANLIGLAESHLGELPATRAGDYVRAATLAKLRSTFADHGVGFTATASTSEHDGSTYTSLAVDAVRLALGIEATAARKAIRDHLKRAGTDSTPI